MLVIYHNYLLRDKYKRCCTSHDKIPFSPCINIAEIKLFKYVIKAIKSWLAFLIEFFKKICSNLLLFTGIFWIILIQIKQIAISLGFSNKLSRNSRISEKSDFLKQNKFSIDMLFTVSTKKFVAFTGATIW